MKQRSPTTMHRLALLKNRTRLIFASLACAGFAFSQAQPLPTRAGFEVASVKPNTGADGRALLQAVQGRLMMRNLALRRLILIAFDLQDYQLSGDPPWANSEHYDIQAKADGNPSVREMEGPMLQALLQDRFRLIFHQETRQLPIYELGITKGGVKMRASKEGNCTPYSVDAPPPASKPGEPPPTFCGFHATPDSGTIRTLDGDEITMAALAVTLSRTYVSQLGRNVVDRTSLTGLYDVHLKWAIDRSLSVLDGPDTALSSDVDGPSLFTALQEQLGLKLESAREPVDVLVIDHIERPSSN